MNWLISIFESLGRIFGKSLKYSAASVGAFVFTMILKMVVTIFLLMFFWYIGWKTGVVLIGIESAIFFLLAWKSGKSVARTIATISDFLFRMKRFPNYAYGELSKLLFPTLMLSLCLSFMATVVAIKGLSTFNPASLLIWISVFLFFYIVSFLFFRRTIIVQNIMVTIVFTLLCTHILIPVQSRAIINWVERTSLGGSNSINMTNRNGDLVTVAKGTWLFDKEIKKIGVADGDVKAKIMDTIDDDKSGEPVYELLFPVSKGVYIGGNTFFVPIRLIEDSEQITSNK